MFVTILKAIFKVEKMVAYSHHQNALLSGIIDLTDALLTGILEGEKEVWDGQKSPDSIEGYVRGKVSSSRKNICQYGLQKKDIGLEFSLSPFPFDKVEAKEPNAS